MTDEDKGRVSGRTPERVEDLWTRFVARESLSADERAELAAALEQDEVLRRRLVQDLQLEGVLRAAGELERGQEHVVAQVQALVTAHGRTEEVVAAVRRQLEDKAAARRWAIEAAAAPSRRTRVVRWMTATALVADGRRGGGAVAAPRGSDADGGAAGGAAVPGAVRGSERPGRFLPVAGRRAGHVRSAPAADRRPPGGHRRPGLPPRPGRHPPGGAVAGHRRGRLDLDLRGQRAGAPGGAGRQPPGDHG